MRLNEIATKSHLFTTREEIDVWCKEFEIKNYRINEDLTVDADEAIIRRYDGEYLPVKFGTVYDRFGVLSCAKLKSLNGAPRFSQSVHIDRCPMIESFDCEYSRTELLTVYAAEAIKSFKTMPHFVITLELTRCNARNYLWLLKIEGLKNLDLYGNRELQRIMKAYIPKGDIFDCQQELMDAGLEEFAEL